MHVAFLNPQGNFDPQDSYWTAHPDFGGQLVYVKELASAVAAKGHSVDIITRQVIDPAWPEFAAPIDAYPGIVNVRIVRIPCGPDEFLPKESLWPFLGTEWVPNITAFYQREGRYPHVMTTHYADGGLAGVFLAKSLSLPFTFTGHSLGAQKMEKLDVRPENLAQMEARFLFSRRIFAERVSMNHAGRIITSTRQERDEQYGHRAYLGVIDPRDDQKFSVVPPGVNRLIFSPTPAPIDITVLNQIQEAIARDIAEERRDLPVVICSSRFDAKKNHIGLVKAFVRELALQEKANLAIVTRGLENPLHDFSRLSPSEQDIMQQIIALMEEHDLWGKVTAFSLNHQSELAAAYRVLAKRNSVFALTALYEPFGLAPLEAMSCGLPAVVTHNGGPTESLSEDGREFGVLVDPTDPIDIARGLLRVLSTREAWWQYHRAGMARVVDRYTWERTAEGYLAVLEALIQKPVTRGYLAPHKYFMDPLPENEIPLDDLSKIYFQDRGTE